MIGTEEGNDPSVYQPSKEVADLTAKVKQDYQIGYQINHNSVTELNDE